MTESWATPGPLRSMTLSDEEMREVHRIATEYLANHASITTHEVTQLVGVSLEQARFYFKRMIIEGEYRRIGITSGTKYVAAE